MASILKFAAVMAAAVAAVQGATAVEDTATRDGLQNLQNPHDEQSGCVRVRWYDKVYDAGIEPGNFLSSYNEVAALPASAGGPVFVPSQATAVSSSQIQYGPRPRRQGTYIFEGMIALTTRMAGRYLFKLTSDSHAHMLIDGKVLIDNGGFHPKQTRTGVISLKAGEQYHMQVWWGNWRKSGEIEVLYCRVGAEEEATDVLQQVSDASGGIDAGDLSNEQLEELGYRCSPHLWVIMPYHKNTVKPFIMRAELKGFFNGDIQQYNIRNWRKMVEKAHLPYGWVSEYGGVIAMSPEGQSDEPWVDTTAIFEVKIAARTVGFHVFWVQATSTALLYVGDTKVVEVSNAATPTWRMGSIWLEKDEEQKLTVYYGSQSCGSLLSVMWQDDLMNEPAASLTPIMTPRD